MTLMHKTIASSKIGPSENLLLGQHLNAEIGYSLYTKILLYRPTAESDWFRICLIRCVKFSVGPNWITACVLCFKTNLYMSVNSICMPSVSIFLRLKLQRTKNQANTDGIRYSHLIADPVPPAYSKSQFFWFAWCVVINFRPDRIWFQRMFCVF